MKKICEIDSVELYAENSIPPWYNAWSKKRIINPEWVKFALTPAQLLFLENHKVVFRPHPRHNPTIEVFIDETVLDSRSWTMLYLLFQSRG